MGRLHFAAVILRRGREGAHLQDRPRDCHAAALACVSTLRAAFSSAARPSDTDATGGRPQIIGERDGLEQAPRLGRLSVAVPEQAARLGLVRRLGRDCRAHFDLDLPHSLGELVHFRTLFVGELVKPEKIVELLALLALLDLEFSGVESWRANLM